MRNLRDLADENGLEYVSTTDNVTGYPSNIQIAITGFENWEEAEKFAEEEDLKLIQIVKKDGWSVWYRNKQLSGPIELGSEDYGDNYSEINPCDRFQFFENDVKGDLLQLLEDETIKCLDDLQDYINQKFKIQDEAIFLEEGEFLLVNGRQIEKLQRKVMRCHIDSTTTAIAAIDDSTDCEKVRIKTYGSSAVIHSADDHANISYSSDDLQSFETEEDALEYYKERIVSQLGFVPENINDIMRSVSIQINHKF